MVLIKNKITTKAKSFFALVMASMLVLVSCNEDSTIEDAIGDYSIDPTSLFTTEVDGLNVTVRDYSIAGEDNSYSWDMGDGTVYKEAPFTHTYADFGNYSVTLLDNGIPVEDDNATKDISVFSIDFDFTLEENLLTLINSSASVDSFSWDFGDGTEEGTSTADEPIYSYTVAGDYTVTLTGFDADGVILGTLEKEVTGVTIPVIGGGGVQGEPVTIDGYDFEPVDGSNSGGYTFWRFTDGEDYSGNPYASTSGGFEGRGAKWDDGHSRLGPSNGDIRIAYQALNVTPNAKYTLEFYSRVATAGDYIEVLVLDGHYATPTAAIASTPLLDASTTDVSGDYVLNSVEFTANASGEIAIMMSAFIADLAAGESVNLDNISLTPVDAGVTPPVVGDPVDVVGYEFEPVDGSNSGGYTFWRFTDGEDYSGNPYASTSGGFEGRGAKWDDGHSRLGPSNGDIRIAYQALNVTPNAKYTLEFYSRVATAGDYIEVLVLDGHYATPTAAIASTPLLDASTTDVSGDYVLNSVEFTANASGEIAIMMSAFIADLAAGESVNLDNITLTPVL